MDPPGDGFKIVNGKCEGIAITIPADDVEWMMSVMDAIHARFLFCLDQEITALIDGEQFFRSSDIPLTIGRMLEQLAIRAEIAFRKSDRAKRLNDEEPVALVSKMNLIDRSAGNQQVITIAKIQTPIHGLQGPAAFVHEE